MGGYSELGPLYESYSAVDRNIIFFVQNSVYMHSNNYHAVADM